MSTTVPVLSESPLADLVSACAEQTDRFRSRLHHDTRYCFELFRRAVSDRCESAWNAIYAQYKQQVRSWVGTGYQVCGPVLTPDDVVNAAFMRFWQAISGRFESFESLSALLRYLQLCTVSTLLDMTRRGRLETQSLEDRGLGDRATVNPESHLLDSIAASELWAAIESRLNGELELQLMRASYVLGLPPQELVKRWPEHFPDTATVNRIKERVLKRLLRDDRLRPRLGEDNG
jgi:RNA polymerase sigma factor (sigma-70 family)